METINKRQLLISCPRIKERLLCHRSKQLAKIASEMEEPALDFDNRQSFYIDRFPTFVKVGGMFNKINELQNGKGTAKRG